MWFETFIMLILLCFVPLNPHWVSDPWPHHYTDHYTVHVQYSQVSELNYYKATCDFQCKVIITVQQNNLLLVCSWSIQCQIFIISTLHIKILYFCCFQLNTVYFFITSQLTFNTSQPWGFTHRINEKYCHYFVIVVQQLCHNNISIRWRVCLLPFEQHKHTHTFSVYFFQHPT